MPIPHLPSELIDPILTSAVRLLRAIRSTQAATIVAPILNVLPRHLLIHTNYAAILGMRWIDTGIGCRLADFWLLDVLHTRLTRPPYLRPLQYKLPDVLVTASEQGRLDVLHWWHEQGLPLVSNELAIMQSASKGGHTDVLDFWANVIGLDTMQYSRTACVEQACKHGHLNVIHWWSARASVSLVGSSGADVAVCAAIEGGHLDVVSWFLANSGVEMDKEYEATLLVVAILTNQSAIADFLINNHGFSLTPITAAFACLTGRASTLTHCLSFVAPSTNDAPQVDGPVAYLLASSVGSTDLLTHLNSTLGVEPGLILGQQDAFFNLTRILLHLESFAHLGDALESWFDWYDIDLIPANVASFMGHAQVLDWLADYHGEDLQYTQCAVISAATNGHLPVVQWWIQSLCNNTYQFPMAHELVDKACLHGHFSIVQYLWETSQAVQLVQFEYTQAVAFPSLAQGGWVDLARWWIGHVGIPDKTVVQRAVMRACKHEQRAFLAMMMDCRLLASVDDIGDDAIASAAKRGHVAILEWWASQPSTTRQRTLCRSWLDAQDWPAGFDVLDWMVESELLMRDDVAEGSTTETDWFVIEHADHSVGMLSVVHEAKTLYLDRCLDLTLSGNQAIVFDLSAASMCGQIAVLDWAVALARRGRLKVEDSWDALVAATQDKFYHVLDWWVNKSGLELSVTAFGLGRAIGDDEKLKEWWLKTGLVSEEELELDAAQQQEWDW